MCTLTVIPVDAGVRVKCNRDESRLRPTAQPPQVRACGGRQSLMPIDPVSDGTWIAATNAGLALVLMNVYAAMSAVPLVMVGTLKREPTTSRGGIIPHLAQAGDLAAAVGLAGEMNLARYEPFRLVVLDRSCHVEMLWAAGRLTTTKPAAIQAPLFFTSSGLGNEIQQPRERLFAEMFAAGDWTARQDEFHHHAWPENPRASVWMTRPEATTVSCTTVLLTAERISMEYEAREGDAKGVKTSEPISLAVTV